MASEENTTDTGGTGPAGLPREGSEGEDRSTRPRGEDQPHYIEGLSPAKEKALAALLDGKSAVDAAAAAGVSRMTIHRWQFIEVDFVAALKLCRFQMQDAFRNKLAKLNEKAVSTISTLLDKGDFRAAKLVVSFLESNRNTFREEHDAKEMFHFQDVRDEQLWLMEEARRKADARKHPETPPAHAGPQPGSP